MGKAADIYIIGGGAMMYMGSKAFTKDIDLVVRGRETYSDVRGAMIRMGFKSIRPGAGYERMNLSDMLERDDGARVDLFDTRVCSRLELSESMAQRAVLRHSSGEVKLFSCTGSDVLIFKSITNRDRDIDDCMSLIENGEVDWRLSLGDQASDCCRRGCVDNLDRRQAQHVGRTERPEYSDTRRGQ